MNEDVVRRQRLAELAAQRDAASSSAGEEGAPERDPEIHRAPTVKIDRTVLKRPEDEQPPPDPKTEGAARPSGEDPGEDESSHEPHLGAAEAGPADPAELDPAALEEKIVEELQKVFDPEIPVNIYELGLIYGVTVSEAGIADIKMTLTSPHCPVAETLPIDVRNRAEAVEGVARADVEVVWDPTWNPEMMSEAAKLELGMF